MIDRELVLAYHRGEREVDDDALDAALGIPPQRWYHDPESDLRLHAQHPGESVVNRGTPYPICRDVVRCTPLGGEDVIVDLGCGAGRVVLYAGVTTPARVIGIELVAERAQIAREAARELPGVDIVEGNALDHDFAIGTLFYIFRPFSVETEAAVVARLHEQASRRRFTVVTLRLQPSLFDPELFSRSGPSALQILHAAPAGKGCRSRP